MDNIEINELMSRSEMLISQHKYEEAVQLLSKAEALNRMNADVYMKKGICFANLEKYEEAKSQFEKVLKIDRTNGLAYFHLGSVSILLEDYDAGYEYYAKAKENGYDDIQLYLSLAMLNEERGRKETALINYNQALKKDALRADVRIRRVRLLLELERFDEAIRELDRLMVTNPEVSLAYHIKYQVQEQQKDFENAEKTIDEAIDLFPDDPTFPLDKAALFVDRNMFSEAETVLEQITGKFSNDEVTRRVYLLKGKIYSAQQKTDDMVSVFEGAMAISEGRNDFDEETAFMLATSYAARQKNEKALELYEKIFEKSEGGLKEFARYFIPLCLKLLGREEEAEEKYREAISSYRSSSIEMPGNVTADVFRAMCLRDIGETDKAMELVEYLESVADNHPEVHRLKASILELTGDSEGAKAELELSDKLLGKNLGGGR